MCRNSSCEFDDQKNLVPPATAWAAVVAHLKRAIIHRTPFKRSARVFGLFWGAVFHETPALASPAHHLHGRTDWHEAPRVKNACKSASVVPKLKFPTKTVVDISGRTCEHRRRRWPPVREQTGEGHDRGEHLWVRSRNMVRSNWFTAACASAGEPYCTSARPALPNPRASEPRRIDSLPWQTPSTNRRPSLPTGVAHVNRRRIGLRYPSATDRKKLATRI